MTTRAGKAKSDATEALKQLTYLASALKAPRITESAARLADIADKDPLTRKVHDSYMSFLADIMDWGELSETGYRDTRRLALG